MIIFGKIVFSLLSVVIALCMLWGLLYLCIPPVKDWTDKNIFKTEQQEEVQENTENTETNMFVNFDTHTVTLEV